MDGTLLNTLDDLAASVNRVLARRGFPTHTVDQYRWFIGDGSPVLITRALPPEQRSPERIQVCLQELLADYGGNWHIATHPYDGIPALLQTLAASQLALSVVTNKPHPFACLMADHFFGKTSFRSVLGQQDGIPKKPEPDQALRAARAMGVPAGACIFLGDSAVDMETARRAGMTGIGAGWGFRPVQELWDAGAVHVIDHPLDLLALLTLPVGHPHD
jgi:phosphoglycolate phosphatase